MASRELIILDRDGVINRDSKAFVKSAEEWQPLPGSIDAIARLSQAGFTLAVASNQSGLARGLFDLAALDEMHGKLLELVKAAGGAIDYITVCPHGPDDGCDCRKPKPGMLERIGRRFGVALDEAIVIGDSLRDLEAGAEVGARTILVRTGNGRATEAGLTGALASIDVFDDLAAAAEHLLEEH